MRKLMLRQAQHEVFFWVPHPEPFILSLSKDEGRGAPAAADASYQVSLILTHLMGRIGPPVRRAAQRDAAHRASRGTRPEGQYAPPKAAIFYPPTSLRAACGALHHGATRA